MPTESSKPEAERARLATYIAASRRVQRRVLVIAVVTLVAAIVGYRFAPPVGLGLALLAVLLAGSGFWITTGHILEWRGKLRELDRRQARAGAHTDGALPTPPPPP